VNASVIAIFGGMACLLSLLWLVYRYSLFVPAPAGLPILIYHKVSRDHEDDLTISPQRLESHLAYIKFSGYSSISFLDLRASLAGRQPLPAKPVLLTFDDGYLNTYELAYPLLRKHQMKATIFLPVAFIGKSNEWDGGAEPLMSYDQIRELAAKGMEFGLHSYRHENFQSFSAARAEADVSECVRVLEENHCPYTPVFAYPYGRRPRDESADRALRDSFRRHGIDFAARIGSRINSLPPKDVYEMKRTIIRGNDSFREFKIKLRKGRSKLF
jgi:peptidoglycan/xylan/chitin deacetylase (PgdA/CDA1 family)